MISIIILITYLNQKQMNYTIGTFDYLVLIIPKWMDVLWISTYTYA